MVCTVGTDHNMFGESPIVCADWLYLLLNVRRLMIEGTQVCFPIRFLTHQGAPPKETSSIGQTD